MFSSSLTRTFVEADVYVFQTEKRGLVGDLTGALNTTVGGVAGAATSTVGDVVDSAEGVVGGVL